MRILIALGVFEFICNLSLFVLYQWVYPCDTIPWITAVYIAIQLLSLIVAVRYTESGIHFSFPFGWRAGICFGICMVLASFVECDSASRNIFGYTQMGMAAYYFIYVFIMSRYCTRQTRLMQQVSIPLTQLNIVHVSSGNDNAESIDLEGQSEDKCSICHDSKTDCATGCCLQKFHQNCLKTWVATRGQDPTCPHCRSKLLIN